LSIVGFLTKQRDYDPHGPCGPTAFWKISDREPMSDDHQVGLNDFLPIVDGLEQEFNVDDDDSNDNGEGTIEEAEVDFYLPGDVEFIEIDG
jgi:hypothetical protein